MSSPGKSLKRAPSFNVSPIPNQSLLRFSAESQWTGDAELAFTSSTLRSKP